MIMTEHMTTKVMRPNHLINLKITKYWDIIKIIIFIVLKQAWLATLFHKKTGCM